MRTTKWRRHETTDRQDRALTRVSADKNDEASGTAEKGNVQYGGSSSSTLQA